MLTPENDNDILERLRHPEREAERHRPDRLLVVRNWLNTAFILMAVAAMAGLALSWNSTPQARRTWYAVAVVSIVVKLVEVALRMPTMLRKPRTSHFSKPE